MDSAVVLLSGGQDSTTCLFWALHKCGGSEQVKALSINYGQRHLGKETKAVEKLVELAGVSHQWLSVNALWEINDSALIKTSSDISAKHDKDENLPASFVPGRNILFLSLAGAYAYKHSINNIVIGASQTDYSGYPDCRNETMKIMELALSFGLGKEMKIHTPLMYRSKEETVYLAQSLPGCWEALAYSHTCYEGKFPPCGVCPACTIRAAGFEKADERDPLIVRYYTDEQKREDRGDS